MKNEQKLFLLLLFATHINKVIGQDLIKVRPYIGKEINTVIEYHNLTIDSVAKKYGGLDSLINNNIKIEWQTVLKTYENNIIADRTLKRIQVGYLNQSKSFFDSQMPIKFSGFLKQLNDIYDKLNNKHFNEVTTELFDFDNRLKSQHYKYDFSPYDTAKYISKLFFFRQLPKYYKENDVWSDTLITENAVIINRFTVKSISKDNLRLAFKNSVIMLNKDQVGSLTSNLSKATIRILESSILVDGYIDLKIDTHFINSLQATIVRKTKSDVIGSYNKSSEFTSQVAIYNLIE